MHQHTVTVVHKRLVETTTECQKLVIRQVIGGVDTGVVFKGHGQHLQARVGVGLAPVVGGAVVHHHGLGVGMDRVARLVHQRGLQVVGAIDQAHIRLVPSPAPHSGGLCWFDEIRGKGLACAIFEHQFDNCPVVTETRNRA